MAGSSPTPIDPLSAVLAELRGLRAAVEDLREEQRYLVRRLLAADDRRRMALLLPLVYALLGENVWTSAELWAAALADDDSAKLTELLASWRTDSGGLRQFGGMLERCEGATFNGLRLVPVRSRDRDGALWRLERVSVALKPASAVVPAARSPQDEASSMRHSQ